MNILGAIVAAVGKLLAWFKSAIESVWQSWATGFNAVWAILVVVGTAWFNSLEVVSNMVNQAITIFDAISFPEAAAAAQGPLGNALAIANTFMPLSEVMNFTISYVSLMVALTTYRLVKSWIPTLS